MEGVMTKAEVDEILAGCSAMFADIPRTTEPVDEKVITEQRLERYRYLRPAEATTDETCAGDCVLKAVSTLVFGFDGNQKEVRKAGLARLILYPDLYESMLDDDEDWDDYLTRVSREDEDVDIAFTYAIADAFRLRIVELVPSKSYCIAEYIPEDKRIRRTINIVTSGGHTDAMYRLRI